MFKSIQWKLVAMFVLLVISVVIVVGTFLLDSVASFYHNEFINQMQNVFFGQRNLAKEMEDIVIAYSEDAGEPLQEKLLSILYASSGPLGIDSYRHYYILEGKLGEVLESSEGYIENFEKTDNIIKAILGKNGNEVRTAENYMDFAVPLIKNGEVKYIIYIKDKEEELRKDEAALRQSGAVTPDANVKILTSCPSCLQGLSRYGNDLQNGLLEADYIVVEMARHILGEQWLEEYVAKANAGGIERVLV